MMTRVGVVGAGPMGRLHAQTIHRLADAEGSFGLARVFDHHDERATTLAKELGAKPCADLASFFDEIDVAVVAVPTAAHFELSKRLLDQGLDLLIEKPLASNVSEGEALVATAHANQRILQVGHVEWFNPAWREASRRVGKIRRIEVERRAPPSDRGQDIDVIDDLMLHDLDWTTRLIAEPITEIVASGGRRGGDRLDAVEAEIRFEGGSIARLYASRVDVERRRTALIIGDAGQAQADLDCVRTRSGLAPISGDPNRRRSTGESAGQDPLESQWLDFIRACRDRRPPINSGQVGVDALHLVERVREAVGRNCGSSGLDDDPRLRG